MVYNFDKMNLYQIDLLKAKYDTCSVMHYNEYAFSKVFFDCLPHGEMKSRHFPNLLI